MEKLIHSISCFIQFLICLNFSSKNFDISKFLVLFKVLLVYHEYHLLIDRFLMLLIIFSLENNFDEVLKNGISICSFQFGNYTEQCPLQVNPKPDSFLRVFLAIKKVTGTISSEEHKLHPFERHGFSVIEWVGSMIDYDHVVFCSSYIISLIYF